MAKLITLVANWKMHGNRADVRRFAYATNDALCMRAASLQVVFCPPTPYLADARAMLPNNARLSIGAQDCSDAAEGARTGDVAASMLKEVGAGYVIIGHSERRQRYGEDDLLVRAKAEAAQAAGLTPILCVGETAEEYEAGKTQEVLARQLEPIGKWVGSAAMIAYEPVWAIGTGKTPRIEEIAAVHSQVKSTLGSHWPVLYGGSVKPSNIGDIVRIATVDGALIGSASLTAESMVALMAAVSE